MPLLIGMDLELGLHGTSKRFERLEYNDRLNYVTFDYALEIAIKNLEFSLNYFMINLSELK